MQVRRTGVGQAQELVQEIKAKGRASRKMKARERESEPMGGFGNEALEGRSGEWPA